MNINEYEAEVISSAVEYFLKQNIIGVSAEQKANLDSAALEAKALIKSKSAKISVSHIQALSVALNLYHDNLKKSLLANPKALTTAEALIRRFENYLEPLLDNY